MSAHLIESVGVTQARNDMRVLENSYQHLERKLEKSDCIYECLMASDGKRLLSIYTKMIVPRIMAHIASYRALVASGVAQKNEQILSQSNLSDLENDLQQYCTLNNDSASRCYRQMMLLLSLFNEPSLRDFFVQQEPPPHPFPQSEEASISLVSKNSLSPPVLDPAALTEFFQNDLKRSIERYTTSQESLAIDPYTFVADMATQYIIRLPLQPADAKE